MEPDVNQQLLEELRKIRYALTAIALIQEKAQPKGQGAILGSLLQLARQ
ncbi:MAG: hypothetical protein WB609_04890 [Candidatus Cybelea sp.]